MKKKLVIEIDDEVYSHVKDVENRLLTPNEEIALRDSIANGTPLPKGHGRLGDLDIYRTAVKKYIAENKNSDDLYLAGCGDGAYHALHIYDCIPTIIEADGGGEE